MATHRALVTGASIGIGKAFATELGRRGHDLVLVARSTAKLEELASELSARHGIEAEVITCDLESADGPGLVARRLSSNDEPIDVLVNNAGRGVYGRFDERPLESQLGQVDLNVRALVALTHAAVGAMVARGSGRILNVASTAGFQPVPAEAVYGATKAFVLSFSEALHEEVRGLGVVVSAVCPGFTRSEFQQRAGIDRSTVPGFLWQEAAEVARAALDALERGQAVCVPGVHNKVLHSLVRLAPRSLVRAGSGFVGRRIG